MRPVLVGRGPAGGGPVIVALDDDDNVAVLLRHGRPAAARLGVALRVAYVWSDCRPPDCAHHRCCHRDLAEAKRLLTALLDEHLTVEAAQQVERDVIHDTDPGPALTALSSNASLIVVGSSSHRPTTGDVLGATTRALLGRTGCPVLVVPHHRSSVTSGSW